MSQYSLLNNVKVKVAGGVLAAFLVGTVGGPHLVTSTPLIGASAHHPPPSAACSAELNDVLALCSGLASNVLLNKATEECKSKPLWKFSVKNKTAASEGTLPPKRAQI
jgi:hypothetical protein